MKAITIRQPWASLVVSGIKDIENRSWPTEYRGRIYIHAAKNFDPSFLNNPIQFIKRLNERHGLQLDTFSDLHDFLTFPRGGIIGRAVIADCVRFHSSTWFDPGGYGFVMKRPEPVPFRECIGFLKFFDICLPSLEDSPKPRPIKTIGDTLCLFTKC